VTLLSIVAGLLVAPAVAAVVYFDSGRRDRPARPRAAWAAGAGAVALGGFALPVVAEDAVVSAYAGLVRPGPVVVVVSPLELVALHLEVGGAAATGVVAVYGVATRGDV
jgi:hypothetical protein